MMSPNQSVLPQNMLPQLLRPYVCSLCYKTFKKKNHLTRHVKIHSDIRQHKCPYCGKAFLRSDNLKKHIRIHTGEKFLCQFCSRGFTDGSNLTKHIRTHTGEGRHRCKFCHQHFAALAALQKHMQEHDKTGYFINTSLVKAEIADDFSCADPNYSKATESFQHVQKLSSPLRFSERNQNPSPDKIFLEETDTFRSDCLPPLNYQEPFTVSTSGNSKETINPIKDLSSDMQDDMSFLLKQFQFLPQKSPPHMIAEKHPTPSAIKIEKITDHEDLTDFPEFIPEQTILDNSINIQQNASLFQCLLCPQEFSSYPSLLKHLKSHISDDVQTPEKWDHKNPEEIETLPAKQLICRYCEQVFTQQTQLLAHMDLTLCKNCGKIFACGVLLNQHKAACKINWMDKEVINEYRDDDDENDDDYNEDNDDDYNEDNGKILEEQMENNPKSKNLPSDFNVSPSLTTIKQEVIFPEIEDQTPKHQLLVYKSSPLPLVDSDLSCNNTLPSRTMKNNFIHSSQILTDSNIFSRKKIISDSIPEILENNQKSEIFDPCLSSLPQAEPLEDENILENPRMSFTLHDSQELNFFQGIPDATEDFSFNVSVFDAYKCAKDTFNDSNGSWMQNFNSSSTLSEFDAQSGQIWCKNCRKHFQSSSEFREHFKLFRKFLDKFSVKNSHKHTHVKNGFDSYFPHDSSVRFGRKSSDVDPRLEKSRTQNTQSQCFPPRKLVKSPKNHTSVFTCSYCHKIFAGSSQLNRHRKIHLGIKNHRCTFCSKTFLRSDNLKKHVRIHLGIKQYACAVCKKRFTDSSNLVKHQRIHNANRSNYFCSLCSRSFLNYQSLCKHMQTHREEHTMLDQFFNDNAAERILLKIPQKSSNVRAELSNSQNKQDKILDPSIKKNHFFELGSSGIDRLNPAQMNRVKKSNDIVDKNSDHTDCNFDTDLSSSHAQCSTEPTAQFRLSDSLEQNEILVESTDATVSSKYKTGFPSSSKEHTVYLPPRGVTAQYLEEQQYRTKRCISSDQNEELENMEEMPRWNHYVNSSHSVSGLPAAIKSEVPEHSKTSSGNIFVSPTEQIKDNLTLDMVFGEKTPFNASSQNQSQLDILERRYQDSLSELRLVNSEAENNINTSPTNFLSEFASVVSTKTEPVSENSDSLTASSACGANNMTEDKLEMSAYYHD